MKEGAGMRESERSSESGTAPVRDWAASPLLERLRTVTQYLHSADILMIGFVSALSAINIVFARRVPYWWFMVFINIVLSGGIVWLGFLRHKSRHKKIIRYLHAWYV